MAKYRLGFVSNSSSSSFVCDVCGEMMSGYDMNLDDAYMYQCENGHIFCEGHIMELTQKDIQISLQAVCERENITEKEVKEYLKEYEKTLENITLEDIETISNLYGWSEGVRYHLPEYLCPLCNFEELDMDDAMQYLIKTTPYTETEVFEYIKSVNKRRKKLRPEEYVEYVCLKLGKNTTILLKEIDERFEGSYKKFLDFIR